MKSADLHKTNGEGGGIRSTKEKHTNITHIKNQSEKTNKKRTDSLYFYLNGVLVMSCKTFLISAR